MVRSGPIPGVVIVPALIAAASINCGPKKGVEAPAADVVAIVGERAITRSQVQAHIDRLPPIARQQLGTAESRRPLVEALVRNELLLQEARRRGLESDPEYRTMLEQQLIALLLRRSLEGHDRPESVSDQDIERHYREHAARFAGSEQVRVSQIVVPDRALAERLLMQVRKLPPNDTARFEAVARKHSTDAPSRQRGGDQGFISADAAWLSPTVRTAAFTLKAPGEVADLVETEHGFHILRLTARRTPEAQPLAEVRERIRQQLISERRARRTDDLIAASRKVAKVQVFADRLAEPARAPVAATLPKRAGK